MTGHHREVIEFLERKFPGAEFHLAPGSKHMNLTVIWQGKKAVTRLHLGSRCWCSKSRQRTAQQLRHQFREVD